jgi:hypothetical protein
LFITKAYSDFVRAAAAFGTQQVVKEEKDAIPVNFMLTQLNLSMIEIADTSESKLLLSHQPFFKTFEILFLLAVVVTFSVGFSSMSHCWIPSLETTIWIPGLISALSVLAFQTLFQMVVMTGFSAKEFRFGMWVSLLVGLVMIVFALRGFSLLPPSTTEAIAIHINSLLMQISAEFSLLPVDALSKVIELGFIIFIVQSTLLSIMPALRFTQTMVKLSLGRATERANKLWITILWLEFFFPVALVVVFSPLFSNYMKCLTVNGMTATCAVDSFRTESSLLFIQLSVVACYSVIRCITLKKHIQSFMDFSVENVSLLFVGAQQRNTTLVKGMHDAIEVRIIWIL